jgi:predicted alpha-1,2-mannosidase
VRILTALFVFGLVGGCGGADDVVDPPLGEVTDPLEWIDPRIGTGGLGFGYGSAFVGAAVPHGLVKLGPDTDGPFGTVALQHYSGYWAGDDRVESFSHLHLHGAGLADYGVLAVMPARVFDPTRTRAADYELRFSGEVARPGSYTVQLDGGIGVELTATTHGAAERFDFGAGDGWIVVDLGKGLGGDVDTGSLAVDAAGQLVTGQIHHAGGMTGNYGGYELYFALRARNAWTEHQVWQDGPATTGDTAAGTQVGVALHFAAGTPVELQVGVSLVSAAGARANLDAELPAWDFAATRAAAEAAWRAQTGVVLVTGGTPAERRMFYTGLYHAFMMPTVISDVDGRYRLAGVTDPLTATWRQMSDLSLWDTYRTVHPLYALLAPESARDGVRSLAAFGAGLGAFPRWPIAIGESGTMLGSSAEIVVADAVVKGLIDVADVDWPRLRAAAMDPVAPPGGRGGRGHVEAYMQFGYVPSTVGRSVSETTEYAHDDFALAQVAWAAGATADAEALMARRLGWRMLFDPAVGFLRGRGEDGSFSTEPFDPTDMTDEYAEANAWHSLWMAGAHDPDGLAMLFGGADGAVAKLTELFTLTQADWENADESAPNFPRPYYWHGNEPDINAPFLFAQLGRPDLTQQWARWIMTTHYTDTPEGRAGNDDGGTLGSWYVFAALGLYPIPGSDQYVVGAPLFPRARIVVDGNELVIEAPGAGVGMPYVAAVTIDGVAVVEPAVSHAQLVGAQELRFEMSATPTAWGR